MGFFTLNSWRGIPLNDIKADPTPVGSTTNVPVRSPDEITEAYEANVGGELRTRVSTVHACSRVIAEGLAQPPCYVIRDKGKGTERATDHPLFSLLAHSPNERQTSYEFRDMLGWHLALDSNAYVFINRGPTGKGPIKELLPCDLGSVTTSVDESRLGNPVRYFLYGVETPASLIWHLKGPAMKSWTGMSTLVEAARAIGLAQATEQFGAATFKNGAKPGAIISPKGEAAWTPDQHNAIVKAWQNSRGAANAHKTIALNTPIEFTPMSNNMSDSQWIEARKFAVTEVCRYFRVSPTKVFHNDGSLSYSSVEMAHIAHDQDTDAHWHERFVQSANKALFTAKERDAGLRVMIDNRAALRGTAKERMEYYTKGIAAGIFTRNEAREMEGFDRSNDPEADKLTPAANLFGDAKPKPDEGNEPAA